MAAATPRRRRTKAQLEQARRRREASRKYRLKKRHRMTVEQYDALLVIQEGLCFICRRAKGTQRALAVDHDHDIARKVCGHDHEESCPRCWRGLLCSRCNDMLAHARDERTFFMRAINYLTNPPARTWRVDGPDSDSGGT